MISTFAPSADQNARNFSTAAVGALWRRQDAPAVDEQLGEPRVRPRILGSGDGMRRNEMHARRHMRCHVLEHRGLHRADVGEDRAGLERCGDLGGHWPACADRNADDDEVGVFRRLGVGLDHLIGDAQFNDALARRLRARGRDDRAHHAVFARRARDRSADQADADQREAIDERSVGHLRSPRAQVAPSPLVGRGFARE